MLTSLPERSCDVFIALVLCHDRDEREMDSFSPVFDSGLKLITEE